METIKSKLILILGVLILFGVTACLDHDFDEPPIVINELPFSANSYFEIEVCARCIYNDQ